MYRETKRAKEDRRVEVEVVEAEGGKEGKLGRGSQTTLPCSADDGL